MKTNKVKKAIHQGNRFGKTEIGIAQMAGDVVAQQAKPRRSIPIAEVHKMIDHEVSRVKASQTIYDDRLAILHQLEDNESYLESLQARIHECQISNKQIRNDLARVNLAITRQMELDGE